MRTTFLISFFVLLVSGCASSSSRIGDSDFAHLTPDAVMQLLVEGNADFVNGSMPVKNSHSRMMKYAEAQHPQAVILSCMDSRVVVEDIFSCGVGDILVLRVAGNVSSDDVLGSLEYACEKVGAKLVIVLGHTSCGAVKSSVNNLELGHITGLLDKLDPAVELTKNKFAGTASAKNPAFLDAVSKTNVKLTMSNIRNESEILKKLENEGKIKIVGGMYDICSGRVSFLLDN